MALGAGQIGKRILAVAGPSRQGTARVAPSAVQIVLNPRDCCTGRACNSSADRTRSAPDWTHLAVFIAGIAVETTPAVGRALVRSYFSVGRRCAVYAVRGRNETAAAGGVAGRALV